MMKRFLTVLLTVLMLFSSTATMKVISAEDGDIAIDQETETVETVSDLEDMSSDEATEEEIIETETLEEEVLPEEVFSTEETDTFDDVTEEEMPDPETEDELQSQPSEELMEEEIEPVAETQASDLTVLATGSCGENATYTIYSDYSLVISGTGDMSEINNGAATFESRYGDLGTKIISVTIEEGITSISKYEFYRSASLQSVVIPSTVKKIGSGVNNPFAQSPNLNSVIVSSDNPVYDSRDNCNAIIETSSNRLITGSNSTVIPSSVTSIGIAAFESLTFTSFTIPDSVISLENYAFYVCDNLTSLTMPISLLINADRSFDGVTNLQTIHFTPGTGGGVDYHYESYDGFTPISYTPWYRSRNSLTEVILDEGITRIGYYTFYNCNRLTTVEIPDSVTDMGSGVFYGCSSLKHVKLSDLTVISYRMFFGCSSLESITIPDSVTTIAYSAFQGTALKSLTMPISIATIYAGSYDGVTNLQSIHFTKGSGVGVDYTDSTIAYTPWYRSSNSLTEIIIDEGVAKIGRAMFYGCSKVSSIVIPDTVTSVGDYAFYSCSGLTSLTMPISLHVNSGDWSFDGVTNLQSIHFTKGTGEGADYTDSTITYTPWFRSRNNLTEVILDEGIEKIGSYCFWFCGKLSSLTIPESVTSIGNDAFSYCTSLASIDLPDSLSDIALGTFYNCSSLTSIVIPESVKSIGFDAFNRCTSLASITIPESVTSIASDAFKGCDALAEISFEHFSEDPLEIRPSAFYLDSLKPTTVCVYDIDDIHPSITGHDWQANNRTVTFKTNKNTRRYGDILPEDIKQYRALNMPEGIWLSAIDDVTFDPLNKTYVPSFRVYDHITMLKEGTDYKVSFKNNSKAGTGSVTVTGKGDYTGTYVKTFNILPKQFDDEFKAVLSKDAFAYTGKALKPTVSSVEYEDIKLKNKTDYAVSYENAGSANEGTYKVFITGKGNYKGTLEAEYVISKTLRPVSVFKVSGIKSKAYTGEEVFQDIIVKDGKTTLVLDRDYSLDYEDNTDAGTAYVTIEGKGIYTGSLIKSFKITPIKLTKSNALIQDLPSSQPYDGKAHEPETVLRYDGRELVKDRDYSVSYKNNVNAGTATITYKGKGNYSGSLTASFTISKLAIDENDVSLPDSYPYEKGGAAPLPQIKVNDLELTSGKDFTVSYKNNTSLGDASIIIKAKGNYEGTVTLPFKVTSKSLMDVDMEVQDKAYSAKAKAWKSVPVLTDTNGKKLKAGTDYDKVISYTYHDTVSVMDGSVKSKPIVTRNEGEPVRDNDILMADTLVDVSVTGRGNYTGTLSKTYRIAKTSLAKAKVTIPVQYYTGKEIEPSYEDLTVKIGSDVLTDEDYEIVSYANNIKKGTATVTIKGIGNYAGTKTVKFTIKQRSLGITIKFNPNGATSGNMKDQMIYKDTKLIKNTFKRTGYTFKGFNTKYDGSGDWYQPGGVFPYDQDKAGTFVMLYAIWN